MINAMKTNSLLFYSFLVLAISFSSCSDEDSTPAGTNITADPTTVSGDYNKLDSWCWNKINYS